MAEPLVSFLYLTYPIFLSIICIILAIFFKRIYLFFDKDGDKIQKKQSKRKNKIQKVHAKGKDKNQKIHVELPLLPVKIPLTRPSIGRLILIILAIFFLFQPYFRDYSDFFPKNYDMEVFFDNEGIMRSLNEFSKKEIEEINLAKNWKEEKKDYLHNLTRDIASYLGIKDFFSLGADKIHSKGQTKFVVSKMRKLGIQTYKITEAHGNLRHILDAPGISRKQGEFESKFELNNTGDVFIKATFEDIYVTFSKIMKPQFKQIVTIQRQKPVTIYHHNVVALTKVRFLPVPSTSNSIYLVNSQKGEGFVPIGYAVYTAHE